MVNPEASLLNTSDPELSDFPSPSAASCYKMGFSTQENDSCISTFSAHMSPKRLFTFKFLRFLHLPAYPRTALGNTPSCLKNSLRIIAKVIFLSLAGL